MRGYQLRFFLQRPVLGLHLAGYYMTFDLSPSGNANMAVYGIYVEKTRTGVVYGIQVEDDTKHKWSVTPFEYVARDYQPPIGMLPDISGYLSRLPGADRAA